MSENKLTISTIEPTLTRRPNDYFREYLDLAIKTAHNATLNLGFAGFAETSTFRPTLQQNAPDLFDESQIAGLTNGLRTEINNNYLRFTETKAQDRYSKILKDELSTYIEPALLDLHRILGHLQALVNSLKMEYGLEGENLYNTQKTTAFINDSRRKHIESERNAINTAFFGIRRWEEVIEKSLTLYSTPQPANDVKPQSENAVKLQWNGEITDLAELVWVLVKTGAITNTIRGRPVTIDDLSDSFKTLFNLEKLDVNGLVSKRMSNTNKPSDGKTFMDTLQKLIHSHPGKTKKS
jgi:hypothetical protein